MIEERWDVLLSERNILYNGMDVFREAQKKSQLAEVYAVNWDCSEEFEAPSDVAISFIEKGAYIAFDKRFDRTGGTIDFYVKTQVDNALLMYNSGPPSKSDFVALEILNGKLRLILDKGNGALDLNSSLVVNDGSWHHIESRFSPSHIELGLDDQIESRSTLEAQNKFFDLSDLLFIGGVEVNKQARAVRQGASNGDKSLEGCIKDLKVNEKPLGIRDPRTTLGIKTECNWAYPCLKSPCIEGAKCLQEGTDGFKCECDLPLCVRQNFTTGYSVFAKTTQPVDMEE
ncbi:Neurexin-1 [Armadillidium nasatum]|uniref:Neurexin-1 n=1 Tax=Armadillidium nasatum TaxID=96803 RepID=A0A5N5TD40_9CRUS|nr:Neurexin-1 [Armadillidium nasatum]